MISEPLIVGTTEINLKGGIWMESSNSVNQNQHHTSQTGQNDTERLAGEVDKPDIKTDVSGKEREETCIPKTVCSYAGHWRWEEKVQLHVVDRGELAGWFKMGLNDWSVSAGLARLAPVR